MDRRQPPQRRRLAILAQDRRGTLARIAGLLAGIGCEIESAAAGPTGIPGVSRLEFALVDPGHGQGFLARRLRRLVHVLRVVELPIDGGACRSVQVARVRAGGEQRGQVLSLADAFTSTVLDVGRDAVTIETAGSTDNLLQLTELLRPYGIRDLARFPAPSPHQ